MRFFPIQEAGGGEYFIDSPYGQVKVTVQVFISETVMAAPIVMSIFSLPYPLCTYNALLDGFSLSQGSLCCVNTTFIDQCYFAWTATQSGLAPALGNCWYPLFAHAQEVTKRILLFGFVFINVAMS